MNAATLEKNEAIALRLAIEELQKRVAKLEEQQAVIEHEKNREKLNVTPAIGYGMFDR